MPVKVLPTHSGACRKVFLVLSFCCALLLLASLAPLGAAPAPPGGNESPVSAVPVEQQNVNLNLTLVGESAANRTSRVAASVEGVVLKVNFKPGGFVQGGAALIELDQTSLRLVLQSAQAALAAAEIKLEQARKNLERSESLIQSKAISDTTYEKDHFAVKAAEQDAVRAEAEVERLKDRIRQTSVRSPFTGFIVEQHTEAGQWLSPGAPVATLVDLSVIKIKASLPERYLNEVKINDPAQVTFDSLGSHVYTGLVTSLIPMAEAASRSLPLEVSLKNEKGVIKAGLLARVSLKGAVRRVLLVPKDALVLDKGKAAVFVVKDNKALQVPVVPGESYGSKVEVSGKIEPGQMVVVQGNERLRGGQAVRIITPNKSE